MRLFIGIETGNARDALWDAATTIARLSSGRSVRKNNIHLTLKFLGEARDIGRIAAAMDSVCRRAREFCLEPDEVVYKERQKMAWCTLQGDLPPLRRLQEDLENALAACGFEKEKRPFMPHITLVRDVYKKWDTQAVKLDKKNFAVPRLVLFESLSQAGGLAYVPRHIAEFGVEHGG